MKPLRITIENINSFRAAQTVDFERLVCGENMFCICGDTGSGKTTIFDAMLLALYGKSKRGTLTELINLSAEKGRVTFEFEAEYGGRRNTYISDRTLSRKAAGSKNTLAENGEIIAEGTKAFELLQEIIGLDREQFTQVALLEQGKFDSFLKCEPADRADVLAKLLGLERFRAVKQITDRIIMDIKGEISGHERELDAFAQNGLTKENLTAVKADIKRLAAEEKIIQKEYLDAAAKQMSFETDKKRHEIFVMHSSRLASEEKRAAELKAKLDKLPVFDAESYVKLTGEREKLATGQKLLAGKYQELIAKSTAYNVADAELKKAEAEESKSKSLMTAAAEYIKSNLNDGDVCPVCGGITKGCHASAVADPSLAAGLEARKSAATNIGQLRERVSNLFEEGKRLRGEYTDLVSVYGEKETLSKRIDGINTAVAALEAGRDKRGAAGQEYAAAEASVKTCREMLAGLGADSYDEAGAKAADEALAALEAKKTSCIKLLSAAEKTKADIEAALPKTEDLKAKIAALGKRRDGFDRLSKLFRAHPFFEFVADEYVNEFALIASDILQRLSGGLYTLAYESKEFYICDFMYDGKKRKAKTLSGGETFLASMSIAIAIMKYVSAGKSFEFFFLDEGFGTLHEEAVDIAISALKELAKDVTVGVISHVDGIREGIGTRITVKHATESQGSEIVYE